MKDLINIKNENGKKAVSAKELYLGLGLSKTEWSRWFATNITSNDYFKEDVDWIGVRHDVEGIRGNDENLKGGRPTMDFAISLDFAKHIAMMARTEKSHEYRNYFIAVEDKLKEVKSQPFESTNRLMANISPLLNEASCTPSQKLIVFKGILRKVGIELPLEILEPINGQGACHTTGLKSHISDFLTEKCEMQEEKTSISELYRAYFEWCEEKYIEALTSIKFGKIIRSIGITNGRSNARRYWKGVAIKN